MNRRVLFAISLGLALGVIPSPKAHAGQLRAGAAKVSITPSADEFPYTIGREKSFVGVHDEVYARALVLDDGTTRVALVVAEVEAIPDPTRMLTEVAQAVGIPEANVMLAATHTHESLTVFIHGTNLLPVQTEEIEHVRKGVVDAARQAAAHLEPARIAFGRGEAYVNINNGEQAGLDNWFDPKGLSDKTLDVVRVEGTTGEPLALLLNYATHAETMYRSVSKDGGYEVSGDVPGAVSSILEASPSGAPVVLFTAPAEADQLSLFKSLQPASGKMPAADEGAAGWAMVDEFARRLTFAAFNTMGAMAPGVDNLTLRAATNTVTCPGGHIRVDNQTHQVTKEDRPPAVIPLQTIRVGDIAFAGVGGDMGTKIGQEIRAVAPVKDTIVISQLAGTVGYILPDDSYVHPGHGIGGSSLKAGCAERVIPQGIADLFAGLKNDGR